MVWSGADDNIRVRTAADIRRELDRSQPQWIDQQSATVRFGPEHSGDSPDALRRRVTRELVHEIDVLGGRTRLHSRRRSGLLLDLILGTVPTSDTIESIGQTSGDIFILELGPGWQDGEIDPGDVFAPRVLSTALLLYEEVWLPLDTLGSALRVLSESQFAGLLRDRRIVPFTTEVIVGFGYTRGSVRGKLAPMAFVEPDFSTQLDRRLSSLAPGADLRENIRQHLEILGSSVSEGIVAETEADLARSNIRRLLGLSPRHIPEGEPVWDARVVNRLIHLNTGMAVAKERAVDVVEYEAGLSRIASEKWYSQLTFNRTFPSADALDEALRQVGVPDIGVLEEKVGFTGVLEVASSNAGQSFRDWFWEEAAALIGSGARVECVLTEFARAANVPVEALAAPTELKWRFVEKVGTDYILGSTGARWAQGYAARSTRGRSALDRQATHQAKRRLQSIATLVGAVEPYVKCPCGSDERFRFCCGPKRTS